MQNREQELRQELARRQARRQELEAELARRQGSQTKSEDTGILQQLGFTGGKPQSFGSILKEDALTAANSPGIHGLQGAQDALQQMMSLGLLPNKPQGEGTAYNIGKGIGDVAGFFGGGELADLARLGIGATKAASLPGISQGLGALEGSPALKRILGVSALGATDPEDRVGGALKGAALGGLGEGIVGLGKSVPKIIDSISPQRHADELLNVLGKGRNLEENAKSIAEDIRNKSQQLEEEGNRKYDSVFNTNGIGQRRIRSTPEDQRSSLDVYQRIPKKINNPQEFAASKKEAAPSILPKDIVETFDRKLDDLHKDFLDSPTIENAHWLQSQLASTARKLKKIDQRGDLSIADRRTMQGYEKARDILKRKVTYSLKEAEKEHGIPFSQLYNEANKFHLENIVPYRETPAISRMAEGAVKNPRNVSNVFKNPEENVQKILGHLGEEFKNKIIFQELAKAKDAPDIVKKAAKLDQKGFNEYLSPEISKQVELLNKKVQRKNVARSAAGILGGAAIGHLLPFPLAKELGPVAGYVAAPAIEKALSAMMKSKGL